MRIETNLYNWFKTFWERVRNKNTGGILRHFYWWYVGAHLSISSRYPLGTNIYSYDWDLCIVLDACRVDVMEKIADEYDFIHDVESVRSVGSTSSEWVAKTFTKNYLTQIKETGVITSNPFYERVLKKNQYPVHPKKSHSKIIPILLSDWSCVDLSDFRSVDEAWNYTQKEKHPNGGGGFPPRPVTDRTIRMGRKESSDRILSHYMQPHSPYIAVKKDIKSKWRSDEISREEALEAYTDNLRYVLDDIEILLNNIDASRVIITADHGEAFAEWGNIKGHMISDPNPHVKKVPLVVTTATDKHTHDPAYEKKEHTLTDEEITNRLKNLGYF